MPPSHRLKPLLVALAVASVFILWLKGYGSPSPIPAIPDDRLLIADTDLDYHPSTGASRDGGYRPQWQQQYQETDVFGNDQDEIKQSILSRIAEQTPIPTPAATAEPSSPATITREGAAAITEPAKKKNGIVTSVWGYDYASMALMLGWTITQHNDLAMLNAEMVLLTLPWDGHGIGLTVENKTRLEKVGWNIRELSQIEINGIDSTQIQPHRRNNLNKLQPFGWVEYEKILYMDADTVVKGPFGELFAMPGQFAAAPDVWFDIAIDSRFNSGVMVFHPSRELFFDMLDKIKDRRYHDPTQGDQDFLQHYWQYRDFKLPFKYNLNIVMYEHYHNEFNSLWDEAVVIHFTIRKPVSDPKRWCERPLMGKGEGAGECRLWGVLEWYRKYFEQMLEDTGFQELGPIG
jgi:hypothetical protein